MPAPKGGNVTSYKKGGPPGPGRPPGPSKHTLILKDALLLAAQTAGGGGPDGLHNYLAKQAEANPTACMAMLSKLIPLQQTDSDDGKIIVEVVKHFASEERVTLIDEWRQRLASSPCHMAANRHAGRRWNA